MTDIANRVAARYLAASEHVLAKKSTGNYKVELVDHGENQYALKVMYTGNWGAANGSTSGSWATPRMPSPKK